MNYERPGLLEKLAGTYVLGTMTARARTRFSRVLAQSAAAQQAVAAVSEQFAPLYRAVAPIQPPAHVWRVIAVRTRARPGVIPGLRPALRPTLHQASYAATHAASRAASYATMSAAGWRGALAACAADLRAGWVVPAACFCLGAALAVGVVSLHPHTFGMHHVAASLPASYVGVLADAGGVPVLTAGAHRHGATMTLKVVRPLAIPPGAVARLWALPQHGAPVAIANVPASGKVMIALRAPAEQVFADVPRLALSYEADPAAVAPTMPFVLSGLCVKLW